MKKATIYSGMSTGGGDDSTEKSRLTSRKGWFAVPKADVALLNEQCHGEKSGPTTKAVWFAFLQLENDRRSSEFEIPIGLIASLAGAGRTATKDAIARLVSLGFLAVEARKILTKKGKEENDANRYRLLRSVHNEPRVGRLSAEGSVGNQPRGRSDKNSGTRPVLKELSALSRESNKENKKNARAFSALPPSASQGGAPDASGEKKESKADTWKPGWKPKLHTKKP